MGSNEFTSVDSGNSAGRIFLVTIVFLRETKMHPKAAMEDSHVKVLLSE